MKLKILTLAGIAAIALAGCQNVQNDQSKHSNTENQSSNSEKKDGSSEDANSAKEENVISQSEETKESNISDKNDPETKKTEATTTKTQTHSNTSSTQHEHQHNENEQDTLKAENIIVSYFNAISGGDIKTLNKIYPSGTEENEQLAKMFESSKVTADIVDMEKIDLNKSKAQYKVEVKLFTKSDDPDFTNNKSKYTLILDMSKGIITNKAITSTDFLE